jgi:hypothetical protein
VATSLYPLPTQRYAGRLLIELDPTADWTGVAGVQTYADGSAWLDYARLPKSGGGVENRILSLEVSDGADDLTRTLRATLALSTAEGSLSSGATESRLNLLSGAFSPAIFGQRRALLQTPLGAADSINPADWVPRFWGYLDEHPASYSGDLSLFARGAESRLMKPYLGDPVWIGTEGELIALPDAIQGVLDVAFGTGAWVLYTPDPDLQWSFPAFQFGAVDDVLQFCRDMARQRGAVIRWWPDATTGRMQLTLFVLQQDKASPDLTFGPGETEDIPSHGSDTTNYRNDFRLRYIDSATGALTTIHRSATGAEKAAFGLQPEQVTEGSTSQINTAAEAGVMLDSIEAALRTPATTGSRQLPWNPSIEVNSLIRFTADARVSQSDIDLYVVNWTEREQVSGSGVGRTTTVDLRGAPVGEIAQWLKSFQRGAGSVGYVDAAYDVYNIRLTDDKSAVTCDQGVLVDEVWGATRVFAGDEPTEEMVDALRAAIAPLWDRTPGTLPITMPGEGQITGVYLQPVVMAGDTALDLGYHLLWIFGTPAPLDKVASVIETASTATLVVVPIDPRGVATGARAWITRDGVESGPFAMVLSAGAYTYGPVDKAPKPKLLAARGELTRADAGEPLAFVWPPIDSDLAATLTVSGVAMVGDTATTTGTYDSDTASVWRQESVGGSWGAESAVTMDGEGGWSFDETASDAGKRTFRVYGRNAGGATGPMLPVEIGQYTAAPTLRPRITSATVAQQAPGTCSPAVPLRNRISVSFADTTGSAETWAVQRFENGVEWGAVAVGIALSTTTQDDEITGAFASDSGADIDVAYLVSTSGGETMWTQTLRQPRTSCEP